MGCKGSFFGNSERRTQHIEQIVPAAGNNAMYDPAAKGDDFDFYGKPDHKAWIWLRPHEPAAESYVAINPDDAFRLGIANGSKVKVSFRRGSVAMKASINGCGSPPAYCFCFLFS
jgi:hypothetical protein